MKRSPLVVFFLLITPLLVKGQSKNCLDEQIELLKLELFGYPNFTYGSITIECKGTGMQLSITTYDARNEATESEGHNVPPLDYK